MIAGMRLANIQSLSCLAHSLQLIIKDGLLLQPSVQQLLSVGRSIVGYHRSNTAFQIFKKIQLQLGLPEHCLIQMSVHDGTTIHIYNYIYIHVYTIIYI